MKHDVPVIPYGYRLACGTLGLDEQEQAVLAIVRDERARGTSYERIAAALNERGYRTRGGVKFYRSAVFALARQEAA